MRPREVPALEVPLDQTARQRIISAAREHFFAHGFHRVTMDDLAEELVMSKKTIYAHFPSKTALVESVLLDKFQRAQEEMQAITSDSSADFTTALHRLLACVRRHTEEIQPPFLRDIQRETPELFQVVQHRRREAIQHYFTKLLGQGRREGLIRKDVTAQFIIEILLGAVEAIINPPRLAELGLSPDGGFRAIISVILEGALTPEARGRL
jgi:AcrR family transcriptional regulator